MEKTAGNISVNRNAESTGHVLKDISFIMTVLNEEASITGFLDSLFAQDAMPSEIIIVDGGSKDKTRDLIVGYFKSIAGSGNEVLRKEFSEDFKLNGYAGIITKIFGAKSPEGVQLAAYSAPGAGISQGRNIAIALSCGSFICASDAGCRLDPGWLHELSKSFYQNNEAAEVVGGITLPYAENFTQACLSVCMLPLDCEINEKTFMPSSRNAGFLKSAWEAAGGYPDYMDFGEDMKFNFNLKKSGYKIIFNPYVKVYWNLRDNPAAVFKQFFRYAKGDAIGRMYYGRHIIRIASLLALAAAIALAAAVSPYFIFLIVFLLAAYSFKPYMRINHFTGDIKTCPFVFRNGRKNRLLIVAIEAAVPFMLIFIDSAKLSGYFYGLFKRKDYKV